MCKFDIFLYYTPIDVYPFFLAQYANIIDSNVAQDLLNLSLLNQITGVMCSFGIKIMCNILRIALDAIF